MSIITLLTLHFFSYVFYFRFIKIWRLKDYLYKHREDSGFLFRCAVYNFEYRLRKKGSWIGYATEFKNMPTFPHGITGVFISGRGKIGKNCTIYQQVTIGSNTLKGSKSFGYPVIGDNVLIGAGAKIIGDVKVGDNCRIGANAVVAHDVLDNSTVVCEIRYITKTDRNNT